MFIALKAPRAAGCHAWRGPVRSVGRMRFSALGRAMAVTLAISAPAGAWAQAPVFDVPAQPASRGVRLLARQAGIQIIVAGTAASGRSTNAVQGRMAVRAALERLLAGSGLTLLSFDGRIAVLGPAPTHVEEAAPEPIVVTGT